MVGPSGGGIKGFIKGLGIGEAPGSANMAAKSPDLGGGALGRRLLVLNQESDHPISPAMDCEVSSVRTSPKQLVTWAWKTSAVTASLIRR